jgi:hypothetical protein
MGMLWTGQLVRLGGSVDKPGVILMATGVINDTEASPTSEP